MDYKQICNIINYHTNNINNNKKYNSYCILEGVLRIIDIELNNYNKHEIKNSVNVFRRKLGNELIQKKLYKILPNILKLEKNDIYSKLINNEKCDENIFKYISYYLELNIIIIKDRKYRYVNTYNSTIHSIILVEDNNNNFIAVYIINKDQIYNIFNDTDIKNILDNFTHDNKLVFNNKIEITNKEFKQINQLKNKTLSYLHKICEEYSINIYKYINDRKLYKKKDELFAELKLKLINKN